MDRRNRNLLVVAGSLGAVAVGLAVDHNQSALQEAFDQSLLVIGSLVDHLSGGGGVEPQAFAFCQANAVGISDGSGIQTQNVLDVFLRVEFPLCFDSSFSHLQSSMLPEVPPL